MEEDAAATPRGFGAGEPAKRGELGATNLADVSSRLGQKCPGRAAAALAGGLPSCSQGHSHFSGNQSPVVAMGVSTCSQQRSRLPPEDSLRFLAGPLSMRPSSPCSLSSFSPPSASWRAQSGRGHKSLIERHKQRLALANPPIKADKAPWSIRAKYHRACRFPSA